VWLQPIQVMQTQQYCALLVYSSKLLLLGSHLTTGRDNLTIYCDNWQDGFLRVNITFRYQQDGYQLLSSGLSPLPQEGHHSSSQLSK
jgi:hypothetical protein